MSKPTIIFFDIETTPLEYYKWQYDRNPFINPASIKHDWTIISACWKYHGGKGVSSVAISKVGDDYNVVKVLRDVLAKADIIVGHCIDRFDIRNLNTRLIYHGLQPLPDIPTVDTKKMAKKIGGFSSNKLDYLAKYLGIGEKIDVPYQLWLDVMHGSKKALYEMVRYNKHDVVLNEQVYDRLLPYMKGHPHVGVMSGEDKNCSCPNCGSTNFKRNGTKYTAAGVKKQEIQCNDCYHYSRVTLKN